MDGWTIDDYDFEEVDEPAPRRMKSDGPFPLERPSLDQVKARYNHICNRRGRPYWNPVYPFIYPEDAEDRPYWNPAGCIGPKAKQFPRRQARPYPCRLHNFCSFCWERRRRESGFRAAAHHAGEQNIMKFSLSLPRVRMDVEKVKEARTSFVRFLKRNGFDRVTCYIHTFGENPAEGAKGHLDGVCSGPDGDPDVLALDQVSVLRQLLLKYHHRPDSGFWEPEVKSRPIVTGSTPAQVKDLILAGFYAGRPTFHTRRVLAGLYGPHLDYRVRMTNVGGKKKRTPVMDLEINKVKVPEWTFKDLLFATNEAEQWDKAMGRPVLPRGVRLKPKHLDPILNDTGWRPYYRLHDDEKMREKYAFGW